MEGDKSHGTCTRTSKNHKSAIENPAKAYEKLAKESLLNRIAGSLWDRKNHVLI
jgi:hypothetical protein